MNTFERFKRALDAATARAASQAISRYGHEGIYSFAIYTSGEYSYVFATLSTEAGLAQVARQYLEQEDYKALWGTVEIAAQNLRWSPCDSPHHDEFSAEYQEASGLLDELWEATDTDSEEEVATLAEKIHAAFLQSLTRARQAGIFEDSVVLNILKGDQSDEERLANAAAVNPPETLVTLRKELRV